MQAKTWTTQLHLSSLLIRAILIRLVALDESILCYACCTFQDVVSSPVSSTQAKEQNVMFQGLFGEVTSRVSSMMAKNLSVPIMFVCLLHLANEKVSILMGILCLSKNH